MRSDEREDEKKWMGGWGRVMNGRMRRKKWDGVIRWMRGREMVNGRMGRVK